MLCHPLVVVLLVPAFTKVLRTLRVPTIAVEKNLAPVHERHTPNWLDAFMIGMLIEHRFDDFPAAGTPEIHVGFQQKRIQLVARSADKVSVRERRFPFQTNLSIVYLQCSVPRPTRHRA